MNLLRYARYLLLVQCHQSDRHKEDRTGRHRNEKYRREPRYAIDDQTSNLICMNCKEVITCESMYGGVYGRFRLDNGTGMLFFEDEENNGVMRRLTLGTFSFQRILLMERIMMNVLRGYGHRGIIEERDGQMKI